MSREKIDNFLEYWHRAVLVEKLNVGVNEAERYREKLLLQIDQYDSVRRMITNPLLCAMVCALHYKNGAILSNERNELYEDCCKMLLSQRDPARDIHIYDHINLPYEEKKTILAEFAYWMMKNRIVVAELDEFKSSVKRTLPSLRGARQNSYSPDEVCNYLIERSGVLRIPEKDKVDFIHKSFQEYLAAYSIYRQDDWGLLSRKVDDNEWYETLILSMGFASKKNAERVIGSILTEVDSKHIVIAAACALNSPSLSSQLRNRISNELSRIIPPKLNSDCRKLAKAGELVVPFLRYNAAYTKDENLKCLNTLVLINSSQTLIGVTTYLIPTADEDTIRIIGKALRTCTEQDILTSGIQKAIISYVKHQAKTSKLFISENMLSLLDQTAWDSLKKFLVRITDLTLVDYSSELKESRYRIFRNVNVMQISGVFKELPVLKAIGKNVKTITICDYSEEFDLYQCNVFENVLKI